MFKKLNIKPDFSDYYIYGISSHEPEFKFCWHINKSFTYEFAYFSKLPIAQTKNSFTIYRFKLDDFITFYILSNYENGLLLLPKLKHFNYFFIIHGTPMESDIAKVTKTLKETANILLISKLKDNESLIFASVLEKFELHISKVNKEIKEQNKKQLPGNSKKKKKPDNPDDDTNPK